MKKQTIPEFRKLSSSSQIFLSFPLSSFPLKPTHNKDITRIRTQSLQSVFGCQATFTLVLTLLHVYLVNLRSCIAVLLFLRSKLYIDYIFLNKLFIELPRRYFIEQHNAGNPKTNARVGDNIF